MKIILPILALCGLLAVTAEEREPSVYLYPEVLETGKNQLPAIDSVKSWKTLIPAGGKREMGRKKSDPFDPAAAVLFIRSETTSPIYWRANCRLLPNRTYLFGGWVRNRNARILFWFHGDYGKNKKHFNQRIYYLTGINDFLKPYLSPETLKKLLKGGSGWEICYKVFKTPEDIGTGFIATFAVGSYFGTGYFEFGPAFVIDITDMREKKGMVLLIRNSKPVKKVTLYEAELRDRLWDKDFPDPVRDFHMTLPDTDFQVRYRLSVDYTDGTRSDFMVPQGTYNK